MMKILIIEDELLIQQSLKKFFEKSGHEVDTTGLGEEAITKIHNNDYDKIVCDLMLQDISGFDVIEESRKKYSLEEISKIFTIITAYSSDQALQQAQSYRCQLIQKPFINIKEAIDQILGNK